MGQQSRHHHFYKKASWLRRARHQLRVAPLCAMCLLEGRTTPATIADHVTPHRGDYTAFRLGKLQSLCKRCHDGPKKRQELGLSAKVGPDGWPLDPDHAVYRFRRSFT
jgi:5-methylcytosine-specific restriction protein A